MTRKEYEAKRAAMVAERDSLWRQAEKIMDSVGGDWDKESDLNELADCLDSDIKWLDGWIAENGEA